MLRGIGGGAQRRQGDQHRARCEWADAADAYRRHLADHPADQPIYVQLGHALKEQGKLPEAMGAYATAAALDEADPDALGHLADALRRLGRPDEALRVYRRANLLRPSEESAAQVALLTRSAERLHAQPLDGVGTLFSVQDLLGYLKAHKTLSGIQRVQAGIAANVIVDPVPAARFIITQVDGNAGELLPGQFWMVDPDALLQVIRYATGPVVAQGTLHAMIRACEATAVRVAPGAGSTIFILGSFWALGNDVHHYVRCKEAGARIGAYIYDLIPITHPELCDDQLAIEFGLSFCELVNIADFFLTISDATRMAVDRFLAEHGAPAIPTVTVALAHHLASEAAHAARSGPDPLELLNGRPYVAYVATIEARKNHLYVVQAWRQLIADGVRVPDLVFVGRRGWKVRPLFDLLEETDYLGGRVHLMHDLSDDELNRVYSGCLFTVFTSIVEGWGLPVGESLYHGRPCVAARASSLPEVGGDLVDYVDPLNLRDGVAVFRRMIEDASYREGRAAEIAARFAPRSWELVTAEFTARIAELSVRRMPFRPSRLDEGAPCQLGVGARISYADYLRHPWRLSLDLAQFHPPDTTGIRARERTASLSIATVLTEGERLLVYLMMDVPPGHPTGRLTIRQAEPGALPTTLPIAAITAPGGVRVAAAAPADGVIRLKLSVSGADLPPEMPAFGIRAFGYARVDDLPARQNVIERLIFAG